jgi:hypothetical protein
MKTTLPFLTRSELFRLRRELALKITTTPKPRREAGEPKEGQSDE